VSKRSLKAALFVAVFSTGFFSQTSLAAGATASIGPSSALRGFEAVRYVADPGETNDVTITANNGLTELTITDPGATISVGPGCLSVSPNQAKCSLDFEVDLDVRLGDGNDTLLLDYDDEGSGAFCAYFGGTGNDTILGAGSSFSSSESLIGGPGNDTLRGRAGEDTLKGGAGADVMSGGTSTACEFLGCFPNADTVTYAGRTTDVSAVADGVADSGAASEGDLIKRDIEVIIGGSGDDVLGGKTINVRTFRGDGKFRYGMELRGRDGADVLRGDRSRDFLTGGGGDDVLRGKTAGDWLSGNHGDDQLFGGRGHDRMHGGRGQDQLFARDGKRDQVGGGRGHDEARIDSGLDHVSSVEGLF
jgi:Ca2+-binding RTX toxin-like protein